MVTVSISETYDLHTVVDKMTLIGIHTPKTELIQKMYPGLCMNYKYFRIKGVDVALSTAQTLPLSPDQIGLTQDKINPQDMMNPILYKAVSNDSWSTLEYRLWGLMHQDDGYAPSGINGDMADIDNTNVTTIADEHGVYYSLLSNRDGFRVAHPQQGLRMKGLKPIVFQRLYSDGINSASTNQNGDNTVGMLPQTIEGDTSMRQMSFANTAGIMRGRAVPMPRINTTYLTGINPPVPGGAARGTAWQYNGMGDGAPENHQISMPNLRPVMLGAIVLPPVTATTGILYYRMVCRAYIEFSEVRPIQDIASFAGLNGLSSSVYHTDYDEQSKNMDKLTDMVDVKNADIEKIMEGR